MLSELGADTEERLYFQDPPSPEEIRRLAARLPGGVMDLVSQRSRRFKELNLDEKSLSEEEWIELLHREPGLWRRPIAVGSRRVVIGYDPEALEELVRQEQADS